MSDCAPERRRSGGPINSVISPFAGLLFQRLPQTPTRAAAPKLFMHLRNFPRQASRPVSQNLPCIRERLRNPMRRFIKNQRAIFNPKSLQRPPPLAAPRSAKIPTNKNSSFGNPEAESAASNADGPGIGTTGI